jgi:hypothetical protein
MAMGDYGDSTLNDWIKIDQIGEANPASQRVR